MFGIVILSVWNIVIPIVVGLVFGGTGLALGVVLVQNKLKKANKTAEVIIKTAENEAEQIKKENVNRLMASPGLLNVITKYCLQKKIVLDWVTKVFTGGGAVFLDFVDELRMVFPKAKIVTLYGSTEAEPIAELNVLEMSPEEIDRTKNGYGILAGKIVGVKECKIIKTGQEAIGNIFESQFRKLETESVKTGI